MAVRSRALCLGALALLAGVAAARPARADDPSISNAQMQASVDEYYRAEVKTSYLFVGYGAVTAGAGAVSLTQDGDFSQGFGWSSLVLGGVTAIGGAAYGVAAGVRGSYYRGLAARDPARFKAEEADRIAGTNQRFWLYLGTELLETAVGIGLATYGFVAKDDTWKGIGTGAALQGIGLFVIDTPGAGRAAKYQDDVQRFDPRVGFSVGGGTRPWTASLTQAF